MNSALSTDEIWPLEYSSNPNGGTPEQRAAAVTEFRASAEYQEGLRICVTRAIKVLTASATTDTHVAAYCDAFATGYAGLLIDQRLQKALGAYDRATKHNIYGDHPTPPAALAPRKSP